VNIANIVDHKTQSEGTSLFLIREVVLDRLVVVAVLVVLTVVRKPLCQVGQCVHHVVFWHDERIITRVTLVVIWCVYEVPLRLEGVALSLYVVSESGALRHGVITFVLRQA